MGSDFVVRGADKLHEILRDTRLVQLINEGSSDCPSFWCWFQDRRATRGNCTDEPVVRNCSREVPRTGNENESVRCPGEPLGNELFVRQS